MEQARENAVLWDEFAPEFEEWLIQNMGNWSDWLDKRVVISRLNPQQDEVIVDAGCGPGRLTLEIARKCKRVYAMDLSSRYISILNERMRRGGIHNIDSFAWDISQPFPFTEQADKVVSDQVVPYILSERQRHQALQNMYDQLRDGGTLVVILHNWRRLFTRGYEKDGYIQSESARFYAHRFTPAEATAALRDCGFKNISVRGYVNFGVYAIWKDRFQHIQHLIALSDVFLSKMSISRYRGYWLICTAYK